MGTSKLLLPWKGGLTVIDATLQQWLQSRVNQIVVVVRSDDHALRERCRHHGVHVLALETHPPQMKDSVAAALQWLNQQFSPAAEDVWLLAPADMPRLSPNVVNRLLNEHDVRCPAILKPTFQQRRGHPVLFPWSLAHAVITSALDQGIDVLTKDFPMRLVECDCPTVLDDMDSPADYEKLRAAEDRAAQ